MADSEHEEWLASQKKAGKRPPPKRAAKKKEDDDEKRRNPGNRDAWSKDADYLDSE